MSPEKSEPVSGDGSPLPPLADFFLANIDMVALRLFRLGEQPNYEPSITESLGTEAMVRGIPVLSVLYDAMLEDEGRALTYFPVYNYAGMNLDVVHEMLSPPLALPGLCDGGAHVGTICDASFPTFLMTHWARDRERTHPRARRPDAESRHGTVCGCTTAGSSSSGSVPIVVIDFSRLQLRHLELSLIRRRAASGPSGGGTSPPCRTGHRIAGPDHECATRATGAQRSSRLVQPVS